MTDHSTDGSDERTFLHDIASPIGTALFLVNLVLESMQARPGAEPMEIEQLANANKALEKLKTVLENRRNLLVKRGVPSART